MKRTTENEPRTENREPRTRTIPTAVFQGRHHDDRTTIVSLFAEKNEKNTNRTRIKARDRHRSQERAVLRLPFACVNEDNGKGAAFALSYPGARTHRGIGKDNGTETRKERRRRP